MRPFFLSLLFCLSAVLPREAWGEPPGYVRDRIDKARDDLALAEATVDRLERRLDVLRDEPGVTEEALAAMETFLNEARALRDTHRDTLEELESMLEDAPAAPDPRATRGMREFADAVAALPEAEAADSELARMLAEFDDSLHQFDRLIHDHFQSLRNAMDRRIASGGEAATSRARAAAEAAALLRDLGVDPGVEAPEGPAAPTGASPPGAGGETEPARPPPRRDEDIVARQLREAAENETDPELREKLWAEYEAYLDGRG